MFLKRTRVRRPGNASMQRTPNRPNTSEFQVLSGKTGSSLCFCLWKFSSRTVCVQLSIHSSEPHSRIGTLYDIQTFLDLPSGYRIDAVSVLGCGSQQGKVGNHRVNSAPFHQPMMCAKTSFKINECVKHQQMPSARGLAIHG
jgi:hypothetical protein